MATPEQPKDYGHPRSDQLVILPVDQAAEINRQRIIKTQFLKEGVFVGTVFLVAGEALSGVLIHPAACGLIPFTIAASIYAHHRIEWEDTERWLNNWLRPHATMVGDHGETELQLSANAKPAEAQVVDTRRLPPPEEE